MTCELQWDIVADTLKGIAQFSYSEDRTNLPSDEHGFYYGVKYGLDGVVTERYNALQPGDMFYGMDALDLNRITTFKSVTRRALSASDYYVSYKTRPFTYLEEHPEIAVSQELLNASTGVGIRYNVDTKKYLVYYVYAVDPRCASYLDNTEEALAVRLDEKMQAWYAEENAKLSAFKSLIKYNIQGFDVSKIAEIIFVPGKYLYVAFWNNDILDSYLLNWPEYSLPKQIYNI